MSGDGTWVLAIMDRAVRIAIGRWQHLAADRVDLYQSGWDGVTEALITQPDADLHDLVRAADDGISRMRATWARHHGYTTRGTTAPRWAQYWHADRGGGGFEDDLIERLALPQVLAPLAAHHLRALTARAAADTEDAARLLGVRVDTLRGNVRAARRAVLALWWEHETPRASQGQQPLRRSTGAVQPCGTVAAYQRHRRRREQACQDCRAAASADVMARKRAR